MPFAGHDHVVVPVDPRLHRPPGLVGENGGDAGVERRLGFLTAEAAAHPPDLDGDGMRGEAERVGDQVLHLARVLRRAVDQHVAVFLRHGERDMAFQIELVLAADIDAALEAVLRAFQSAVAPPPASWV